MQVIRYRTEIMNDRLFQRRSKAGLLLGMLLAGLASAGAIDSEIDSDIVSEIDGTAAPTRDAPGAIATLGKRPLHVELPRSGIKAQELALIVNTRDPLSIKIAEYYQQKRQIPAANVIEVQFAPGKRVLSRVEFAALKAQVDAAIPATIQAYALAWKMPYRVECMSMTPRRRPGHSGQRRA